MKVAFPVKENKGLESTMDDHFGTADYFLIVATDTRQFEFKQNQKLLAEGSRCKSGVFDKADQVTAVITKCMGDGSQRNLHSAEIQVFQAVDDTVLGNLERFEKNELKPFHIFDLCQHKKNKKEGGCGHHH